MNRRIAWVVCGLLIVFGSGALTGVFVQRLLIKKSLMAFTRLPFAKKRENMTLGFYALRLKLTDQQKQQLRPHIKVYVAEQMPYYRRLHWAMRDERRALHKKLESMLSPQQKRLWKRLKQEYIQRLKERIKRRRKRLQSARPRP